MEAFLERIYLCPHREEFGSGSMPFKSRNVRGGTRGWIVIFPDHIRSKGFLRDFWATGSGVGWGVRAETLHNRDGLGESIRGETLELLQNCHEGPKDSA